MPEIPENNKANLKCAGRVFDRIVSGIRPRGENKKIIMPHLPFIETLGYAYEAYGFTFSQIIGYLNSRPFGRKSLIYEKKFKKIKDWLTSSSKYAENTLAEMRMNLGLVEFEGESPPTARRYRLTEKGYTVFKNCIKWKMI